MLRLAKQFVPSKLLGNVDGCAKVWMHSTEDRNRVLALTRARRQKRPDSEESLSFGSDHAPSDRTARSLPQKGIIVTPIE